MIFKLKYSYLIAFLFLCVYSNAQDQVKNIIKSSIDNAMHESITFNAQLIHCKQSLTSFYKNRLYKPGWNSSITMKSLTKELGKADEEGLNPNDYHFERITKLIKNK